MCCRGIESSTYYMTDTSQFVQLLNFSGCGNTVNANNPVVTRLIVDSLVRWVLLQNCSKPKVFPGFLGRSLGEF